MLSLDTASPLLAAALAFAAVPVFAGPPVEQAWLDRYNGEADRTDRGFDVVVDSQGDAIVAGYTQVLIDGGTYWPYYLAVKYAPDGTRRWTRTWASGPSVARALAIDHDDNVILVGSSNAGDDFGIVKLDPDGNELWSRVHVVNSIFVTSFDDVVVDANGAIYAIGNFALTPTGPRWTRVVKYAPDGTQVWFTSYSGPGEETSAGALVVNEEGETYAAGYTRVAANETDLIVLKFRHDGVIAWTRTFGRSGSFVNDGASDLELDADENLVVAGTYGSGAATSVDLAVIRLDPDGTTLSEATYDGALGLTDSGEVLTLDSAGNAIVAGKTDVSDFDDDVVVVKLDADGNAVWARQYGGDALHWDTPYDIAVDHLDHVYVAGEVNPDSGGASYFTLAYDDEGTLRWDVQYGGPQADFSHGMALAVGPDRSVTVTGYSEGIGTNDDAATVRYTQAPIGALGDVDGDGIVGFADLLIVLASWGPCNGACPADLDDDGNVGFADLLIVLGNWS